MSACCACCSVALPLLVGRASGTAASFGAPACGPGPFGLAAFLVLVLILLLLYGGDKLAILGKGLGEGVKAFRKTVRDPEPPQPPPRTISVEVAPPKLLPAKGETSSEAPPDDQERH